MIAFPAEQRTGDDVVALFFFNRQFEFALTDRAGQNIHQIFFHGLIITQETDFLRAFSGLYCWFMMNYTTVMNKEVLHGYRG